MSSDAYRELFERSADAILIIEGDTFVDCNQATVDMLRCANKVEVLRTHPSQLSPPKQPDGRDSFEKANEMISIAFEHGNHRFEWDHLRADGTVFPVEVLLTAVHEADRDILHVVWRDITERKQLEEQLRHAQKMEAIGKLTGGIAHDFNNLLVAILGHAELLEAHLRGSPDQHGSVSEILAAGEKASALVRQLLAFSRKQELRLRVFDLAEVLRSVESLLERLIGEDILLSNSLPDTAMPIRADPGQIEQVIINLVTNARDAMPDGGRLNIGLRPVVIDEDLVGVEVDLPSGAYALLSVTDCGIGMDDATRERAFDPFFTTKEVGAGTGLGLATCYGIVQQSHGAIEIRSASGVGTTVNVYFALDQGTITSLAASTPQLDIRGGHETILVAEDEPAVANLVVTVLESAGYRVLMANHGEEALALWQAHRDQIDLLLSDVVMPRMGGPELLETLRSTGFSKPVLFASGYTNDALVRLRKRGDAFDLLEKPFSTHDLIGRVRRALDGPTSG